MARENNWLVRSGGRIIGPYKSGQIPQLLKSREIQLRDEIAAPLSRWFPLERHPDFVEEVEQFKREILTEKTEISFTPTETGATQTSTDLVDSELTEEITQDLSGFTNTREIVVDDVQDIPGSQKRNLETAQYQLKGLDSSPYVRGRSKKASFLIQGAVLLCALGAAAFIFLRFQNQRPAMERLSTSQVKSVVLKLIERGEYSEALNVMQSKQGEPGFVSELGIYYALLSLQEDGQSLTARRILTQLLESQPDLKVRALTGIGLSYLVDQSYSQAKGNFQRALAADSTFVAAKVDLLISDYLSGSSQDFSQYLLEPWIKSEAEALITSSLALMKRDARMHFDQVIKALEVYSSHAYDFQLEAKFIAQYLKWRKNPNREDLSFWEDLVDTDPLLTDLHRHNVFVYRKHLSWNSLLPYCIQMTKGKIARIEAQLLNAFCHFKAGRFQEARMQTEAVVDKNPKYGLGQAWYALTLRESGSADQASVALGRALEADRKQSYRLPLLLQGRFCDSAKNWSCAYESWKKLLEIDYTNLAAIAGLAKINHLQQSQAEGEKFLKRGLALSPDYKPFLALKDEWRDQL